MVSNIVSIKSNSNKSNILGNIYHRTTIMLENKKITDDILQQSINTNYT